MMRSIIKHFTLSAEASAAILAIGIVLLGAISYFWYLSSGKMVPPSFSTNYFDLQAQGYLKGQLSLPVQPDPRLLAMANPYLYRARGNLPVFWDASLYHGHYYLYWGPTPALIAAAVKLVHPLEVSDAALVFIFETATLIFGALLFTRVRQQLFPNLPGWIILPPLVMFGFANPVLYILNRPSVYEAAITGGQAFLIAGLLFAFRAIDVEPIRIRHLALAGVCWAFSFGSRQDLIPAIAFLSIGMAIYLLKFTPKELRIRAIIALGFPLVLGVLGLGGYNLARFGSILETGHRYQLTGLALPADPGLVLSPLYIPPNLYSYLFRPNQISLVFPFLSAPKVKPGQLPLFIHRPPAYYYAEPVSGMLWTLPFSIFSLFPLFFGGWSLVWSAIRVKRCWAPRPSPLPAAGQRLFRWLFAGVAGTILLNGGLLLIYISASMRYELDLLPAIAILAGLGFAWGYQALHPYPKLRKAYVFIALILMLYTLTTGLLLGFSGYNNHFQTVNLGLFDRLAHVFAIK
jgi:hypothetical protein